MVARVFIDGEAGTTGLQIRERLAVRRDIELLSIPDDLRKDTGARSDLLNKADVAILCLPDAAAKESVSLISSDTTRVIDASTAHRVAEGWAYGFAEMDAFQGDLIANAKRVANPGCWPQGMIAFLRPLIAAGLLPASLPITMNGISGYSGGGKSLIADYEEKGEAANSFAPYALTFNHKHLPEMQAYTGLNTAPLFAPAVGNFYKGMLTCIPLNLATLPNAPSAKQLHEALSDYYAQIKGSFVEVAPFDEGGSNAGLNPQALNDTNSLRLHVFGNSDRQQVMLCAVYDNLGKGASGAAVQNLNLMLGVDVATSLAA